MVEQELARGGRTNGVLQARRWVHMDKNAPQIGRWAWQDGATGAQVEIAIKAGRLLAGRVMDPAPLGDGFEVGQRVWLQRCVVTETHDGKVVAEQQQVRVYSEARGPAVALRAGDAEVAVTLALTRGGQLRPACDGTARWRSATAFWQAVRLGVSV